MAELGFLPQDLSEGCNQVSTEAGPISSSLSGCWQFLTGCWIEGLSSLLAVGHRLPSVP